MKCRTCCNPAKVLLRTVALLFLNVHRCTIFTFLITDELPLSVALYGVYILSSGTPGNCSTLFSVGPEYAVETSFLHWPSLSPTANPAANQSESRWITARVPFQPQDPELMVQSPRYSPCL